MTGVGTGAGRTGTGSTPSASAPAPVTWLYVPGDRPERFGKAAYSGADVVVIDLEDAVGPAARPRARAHTVSYLSAPPDLPPQVRVHVRVNDPRSPDGRADLTALRDVLPQVSALRVPKVEAPEDIDTLAALLGAPPPPLHALLESAAGVENAAVIARHPLVTGLAIGEADLRAQLGLLERAADPALAWVRSRVVLAAAAAGLPPVAMSVYPHIRDPDGLAASCAVGRGLGMFGRAVIHPAQLAVVRRAFTPSQAEVDHARDVIEAAELSNADGTGALALTDGRFVDAPIIRNARRTLELAARLSAYSPGGHQDGGQNP